MARSTQQYVADTRVKLKELTGMLLSCTIYTNPGSNWGGKRIRTELAV